MNLIYHPDSLSLVVPSYSRRGVLECAPWTGEKCRSGGHPQKTRIPTQHFPQPRWRFILAIGYAEQSLL